MNANLENAEVNFKVEELDPDGMVAAALLFPGAEVVEVTDGDGVVHPATSKDDLVIILP